MKGVFLPLLLSLVAGMIYPLGFAPLGWWPLAIISVALAFYLWSSLGRTLALWSALIYGLGTYGVGVSWVYVSMVNFGNMQAFMAVIAVALFAGYLSLFFVLMVMVYRRLAPKMSPRYRLTLLLPALWVVGEALRGKLFTGFAWLYLGYAGTHTWYAGWATLAGVLAVSLVLAWLAGTLVVLLRQAIGQGSLQARALAGGLLLPLLVTLLSWGLSGIRWTQPSGESVDVSLVQANVSLAEKWHPASRERLLQTYLAASRALQGPDLIVWPEAALPMTLDALPAETLAELSTLGAALVFGVIDRQVSPQGSMLYNAMVGLEGGEPGTLQIYHKRHLVPFGEFFPLKPLLGWLFDSLQIPMSDFADGAPDQETLKLAGTSLLPTICYEDAYPEDWRHQVEDAGAILNISEDAWFGDSFAPHQRLQMARMRAIEFQRPLIRASNNGLSTVIDDYGRVDALSPQFQPALFNTPLFPTQGLTPYARFGRLPLWLWLGLGLAIALYRYRPQN